ncbi:MAG: hypothetical protein ACYCWW_19370 [Deltaproteobacteria bacterium]
MLQKLSSFSLLFAVMLAPLARAEDVASSAQAQSPASGWAESHPDAAATLQEWIHQYPHAAHRVFVWDARHPGRAQAFVRWAATANGEGLPEFEASHADWPVVGDILKPYRPALEAFVSWARANHDAASELVATPRGLAWVGFHVFRPDWQSEIAPAANAVAADGVRQ